MDDFQLAKMFLTGFIKGFLWTTVGFVGLLVGGFGILVAVVKIGF